MTRAEFLADAEREYWLNFRTRGLTGEQIAKLAGVERQTVYKRYAALGIERRPVKYGNAAWQALAPETAKKLVEAMSQVAARQKAPDPSCCSR